MRRAMLSLAIGLALSALAAAQGPSTSNQLPDGVVPGPSEIVGGNGCPCAAGTPEGEADCGVPTDTVNGGCNFVPYLFSPISLGETVCGTADWNVTAPGLRDTDWYQYTVSVGGTYTWQVEAEFPASLIVVDGNAGCPAVPILGSDFTTGCGDIGVVSLDLAPGTYWFFVAPDFGGPAVACGAEYTATLWAELPAQAIPAVGQLGLAAIAVLLAGLAFFLLRRRHAATT